MTKGQFTRSIPFNELGYLLAEQPKNVVIVMGAGLSVPAGLPLWPQLLSRLRSIVASEADPSEHGERLRKLEVETDPWRQTDIIQKILGQAFPSHVRSILTPARKDAVQLTAYPILWQLNVSGFLNFNLDNLCECAGTPARDLVATGGEAAKYQRFLLARETFLMHPHGRLAQDDSWVLGERRRNALLSSQHYKKWMSDLLASRRLVIVGFNPADLAFLQHLLNDFRGSLERGVNHFWLTPKPDEFTSEWANDRSITVVPYEEHSDLTPMLEALASFKPRPPSLPLHTQGTALSVNAIVPDADLRVRSVADIRRYLDAALASRITQREEKNHTQILTDLLSDYSGSSHMAWHITDKGDFQLVWRWKVLRELGQGAFAKVWEVQNVVDGQKAALKVLHAHLAHEDAFLEAFRRGVRAHRVLSDNHVLGLPKLLDSFEIPSAVAMELVEGQTFEAFVESQVGDSIEHIEIIEHVARIVLHGHELSKQVLHRDLKPANVMLRKPEANALLADRVTVLDFDLSWYEGAFGKSTMVSRLHNYIAPEQTQASHLHSSRHTAVDAYGIGMLLRFAMTREHPQINEQGMKGYFEFLWNKITRVSPAPFAALSYFTALTILEATALDQPQRIGIPTIIDRLRAIRDAANHADLSRAPYLLPFEISQRLAEQGWRYRDPHPVATHHTFMLMGSSLVELSLDSHSMRVRLSYTDDGTANRATTRRYGGEKVTKAAGTLRRAMEVDSRATSSDPFSPVVEATIAISKLKDTTALEGVASLIVQAASTLAM